VRNGAPNDTLRDDSISVSLVVSDIVVMTGG
jgi:hypothetical protein